MALNKQNWIVLPIDEGRFEVLFGLDEIRKFFKPPKSKEDSALPTLDPASLGMEALEEDHALSTFDAVELLAQPPEPQKDASAAVERKTVEVQTGMRPPAKAR